MASIVSFSGRIISTSKLIAKAGTSNRREIFILSEDMVVFRLTLWPPLVSLELKLNQWISFERFAIVHFKGQTLSSKSYSRMNIIDQRAIEEPLMAKEITGGIEFTSFGALKASVQATNPSKPAFGFIKGKLVSFDSDFTYLACNICRKSYSALAICSCEEGHRILAIKLAMYIQFEENVAKVAFFSEALSSLLGFDSETQIGQDSEGKKITDFLLKMIEKKLVFRVKLEQCSFENEVKETTTFYRCTAQPPVICLVE